MGRPVNPERLLAIAAGGVVYFTGKPCCLGMVAGRLVSDNKCQCLAHTSARAKNANGRYLRDRHKRIERASEWAFENPDSRKKAARDWAARNSEKVKANTHKRRAGKLNATPGWFGELDELVMREAHAVARQREIATGIKWEVDHVVPLAGRKVCGLHVAANMQVIPMTDNRRKSNHHAV